MTDLEIVWEESPLDIWLEQQADGAVIPGPQLLALADGDADALEDAFDQMELRQMTLDISGLPPVAAAGETALRLKLEEKLAAEGLPVNQLDAGDPLRLYLEELARVPVPADEMLLVHQLCRESREAIREQLRSALAEMYLGRVVQIAREYAGRGVLLLDLIQEGSIGLWRATESEENPEEFLPQLERRVRFYMEKEVLRQAAAMGMGQKLRSALEDYRSVDEKLLTELGRNPTVEEIAEGLHISVREAEVIGQMVENARHMHRVKTPEPEQLPQEEEQAVEDTAYFRMRQRIQDLLSVLPEEDAALLRLRYGLEGGLPLNPAQTAGRLGLTEQEVIQREAAALAKLRQDNG